MRDRQRAALEYTIACRRRRRQRRQEFRDRAFAALLLFDVFVFLLLPTIWVLLG